MIGCGLLKTTVHIWNQAKYFYLFEALVKGRRVENKLTHEQNIWFDDE